MPQLRSPEDVKDWLSSLYGETGVVYRDRNGAVLDKSDRVKFDRVMGFKPAKYPLNSEQSRRRWDEEGPHVWTVLLEGKVNDFIIYHIVTVYGGAHNNIVRAFMNGCITSEEEAWKSFASREY